MNMNEMTETEQKCYMVNTLAEIKDKINAEGGNVTDSTPYDEYPSKISAVTHIEATTITPTTSQQTITASGNVDGFSPITVNPVTADIDANIVAGNIKAGVTILGVEGSYDPAPQPVQEDWFELHMYENGGSIVGVLHPTSRAINEFLKKEAGEDGDGYIGNIDLFFTNEGGNFSTPEDYIGVFMYEASVDRGISEPWVSIESGATYGFIDFAPDFSLRGVVDESSLPDVSDIYGPSWKCGITWNLDGTFNLTNIVQYTDWQGNIINS